MDGHARPALTSSNPDSSFAKNFQNGQRGYIVPTLSRSSSVREGSGKVSSRDTATSPADLPALSQCLMLEPVVMGDPKYARSGEFKRALGFSVGSNPEENSFRAAHLKKSPPAAVEEIKRLRSSVIDTCVKASGRAKKLDQHLNKLNKFCEAMPSKKQLQQRNEVLTNEQLSNGPPLKIGSQMHRNPSDTGSQRLEDRPKSVVLNKRIRTSVAEARVESRNNGVLRQPLVVTKESDILKDNDEDSDIVEEKIRRLPTGEGWDRKMKRKRSVGAVFSRSVGNDGELKRNMHHKLTMESTLQSSDSTQGFRSGASSDNSKLDPVPSHAGSTARLTLKNEQEKSMVSRDLSGKVTVKLSNREDTRATGSNPVVKGKASRAPRSVSITADNSATVNVPRLSGTLESWDPAPVSKTPPVGGANNRKRSMNTGLCSPSITQWGGQRPQKISRTRRTNIAPLSNQDEIHSQSEGCLPSDFGSGISIVGINASLLPNGTSNGNQNFKVKPEIVPSPVRLSESEEYCSGEIRINDIKGVVHRDFDAKTVNAGQNVGSPATFFKKNKIMVKEEIGEGVRRQGHSGRVSPFSRPSMSPTREKLDTVVPTMPFQNERSDSDKSGRKSGRPLKKQSDRRGFSRAGNVANRDSPDCSGESDDLEELLTAANLACSSSFKACSSPFWKTFDVLFASVGLDEKSYLSEQLKLTEESCASVCQNYSNSNASQLNLDGYQEKRRRTSDSISCRRSESMKNKNDLKESLERVDSPEQLQFSSLYEFSTSVTPLSQRLLSAMIIEDETEDTEGTGYVNPRASFEDSFLIGSQNKLMGRLGFGETEFGVQTRKNVTAHNFFPCNGSTEINGSPSAQDRACYGELLPRDVGYVHSGVELLVGVSRCNIGFSSSDVQYGQMCLEEKLLLELESVGLFLEAVPALDNKEDEFINQELAQLERKLHEQVGKKKTCLNKIYKAAQQENIARDPEQVAMDKLVEMAYKKLLATRGSFATKHGIPKVSKQVALAFSKRTLARCQKFEDSGASCFSESAFREIVYAAPTPFAESELLSHVNLTVNGSSVDAFETPIHQPVVAVGKIVPMSIRGRKKEVLLDDVVGFRAPSPLGILGGGAKGKRSERDRDRDVNIKGDRKTKAKVKQKAAQLSMSANVLFTDTRNSVNPSLLDNVGGNMKKNARFMSVGNAPLSPKETNESMDLAKLPINEVGGIEELDVDSEIGAPQDINSWLSFEVDGLQDHDGIGLEIPNDDLSDLNMF